MPDPGALVAAWLWPLARIGAMVMVAPVFGNRAVPARIRVALALALTLAVAPGIGPLPAIEPFSAEGFLVTAGQLLVGLALGFSLRLAFAALELAGQQVAHLMGLGFASLVDPQTGIDVPTVSQFYVVLGTLVFLGLDGHLILVVVLAESFHTLPIGLGGIGTDGLWRLAGQAGWLFSASLLIALPVVTSLLIVNLSFGVMSRATPSLNVFTLGFPVALGFGFTLMWVTVPVVAGHLEDLFSRGIGLAATLVGVSR